MLVWSVRLAIEGLEGLDVIFRNIPGSAITRVSIDGEDAFAFDPEKAAFYDLIDGHWVEVKPNLSTSQVTALREALMTHFYARRRMKVRVIR